MGPFEFGNTTVRSAVRLRDGLIAIQRSGHEGPLRGREGDRTLIKILGEAGVVDVQGDVTNSVGRKWRAAMCKMGLLFDEYPVDQDQIGTLDTITPNGLRLIDAESLSAQQDCFLRALVGFNLSFNGRSFEPGPGFSPLKHILNLLLSLREIDGTSSISFMEFACFGQFAPNVSRYEHLMESILQHRNARKLAENKKRFDASLLASSVEAHGRVQPSTYIDYADENIRYLKATGLFISVGRGIAIPDNKIDLAKDLSEIIVEFSDATKYWKNLTSGAPLPTDNEDSARKVLDSLVANAEQRGIPISSLPRDHVDVKTLTNARYDLEERIALDEELEFANKQILEWQEISQYLCLALPKIGRPDGFEIDEELQIPRGEGPAYLEWAVWRAFLAINSICNPPFESRKFRIDRDFRPIAHAPGGGPDLVFEFDNYTLIVEVTLLTTDRQASAELVGVKRHVYQVAKNSNPTKPVYCLFIAPIITNMVGRDFRTAVYEDNDGTSLDLTIIPITLGAFIRFFIRMVEGGNPNSSIIPELFEKCDSKAREVDSTTEWLLATDETFSLVPLS